MSRANVRRGSDGKWRKWQLVSASSLGMIDPEEAHQRRSDGSRHDWMVWVVTGVYNTKGQAYRSMRK